MAAHAEEQNPPRHAHRLFRNIALHASNALGTPWSFGAAIATVVIWACLGPVFHFSDTWQLVINTGTTIITFLMVFLIQNTQNREAAALRVKVDEIVRALKGARNSVINAEELDDDELERLLAELHAVARQRNDAEPASTDGEPDAETERQRSSTMHAQQSPTEASRSRTDSNR